MKQNAKEKEILETLQKKNAIVAYCCCNAQRTRNTHNGNNGSSGC